MKPRVIGHTEKKDAHTLDFDVTLWSKVTDVDMG